MTRKPENKQISGLFLSLERAGRSGFGPSKLAQIAGALWVVAVAAYCVFLGQNTGIVLPIFVAAAPLAPLLLAGKAFDHIQDLRKEAEELRQSLEGLRHSDKAPAAAIKPAKPSAEPSLSAPRPSPVMSAPKREVQQPSLALETPEPALQEGITADELIRALQFPESPEDEAGKLALRQALADREVARLIRSAQDVLTLLSQEGVFMDNLPPEATDAGLWRRFASGERGAEVAPLGAIYDRGALALTMQRLREDPVFRDAAHHFLRTYDRFLQAFAPVASDQDLRDLAQTRTCRAFMLCGRAIGVFE